MIYRVRQTTAYAYHTPVTVARHVLRLIPGRQIGQTLLASHIAILPAPAERRDSQDFFGNLVTTITFDEPHFGLTLESDLHISVDRDWLSLPGLTPPWEVIRDDAFASDDLGPRGPAHFIYPSRLIPNLDALRLYAAESFVAGRPVMESAQELAARIHTDFAYTPGATDVTTPIATAFDLRKGVCQDFAQVMIGALRAIGVPASYVSGYLRTEPPPGQPRLQGADATHAWVSVWCGAQAAWVDIDPTNNCLGGEDHVVLARGRDYADVAPVEGVILASGNHDLDVTVDVIPGQA